MIFQHPADRGGEGRGRFERLAEVVSRFTSSLAFFLFCLALVAGRLCTPPGWTWNGNCSPRGG